MAPTVQRHVQVRADKLKSATISAAEASRIIVGKAIDRGKLSYLIQSGSSRIGTTRYVSFSTAFSVPPHVELTRLGSWDYPTPSGSLAEVTLFTVSAGSFSAQGTPTQYAMYIAHGSA